MIWKYIRKLYRKKLNRHSPSLCLAKWTQSNIYLQNGTTHSCHHPTVHKIPLEELKNNVSALHNTSYKKDQRKLMLNGARPNECDYCWRIEDSTNDVISDRITKSFDNWSRPYLNHIIKNQEKDFDPKYLEISFDNICNLKCSYCSPENSTKWIEELNRYGDWPDYHKVYNSEYNEDNNPYIEAFWKYFPTIYKDLHTLRITGGEPLLSKNLFKILNYLETNRNENLCFSINTNLSVPNTLIYKLIDALKKIQCREITIHTSCDGHKNKAEYGRYGLSYNEWYENCHSLLTELPNIKINVMVTYNVFSVTNFKYLLKDIKNFNSKRVYFSINYLRYPEQLAVWVLPNKFKSYIEEQIQYCKKQKFSKTEINQLERLLSLFGVENAELQKKFYRFILEHDRRRNTNFEKTFPELKEFYNYCKRVNDEN